MSDFELRMSEMDAVHARQRRYRQRTSHQVDAVSAANVFEPYM